MKKPLFHYDMLSTKSRNICTEHQEVCSIKSYVEISAFLLLLLLLIRYRDDTGLIQPSYREPRPFCQSFSGEWR